MLDDPTALPSSGGEATVLGLDNVAVTLPVAGVGSRVLAAVFDYAAQAVLQIVWVFTAFGSMRMAGDRPGWGAAVYVVGIFVIDWGYFSGSEILFRQQTLGKRIVRLRVVTREGGTPTVGSLLVRNLTRPVDLLAGIPMIALDPLGRRLGDRLAGTLVVHEEKPGGSMLRRVPEGWTSRDIAAVEMLLERSSEMEPERVERMASRLVGVLAARHPEFLSGIDRGGPSVEVLRRAFAAGRSG
ncbi:MAG TPA: RDD family protein [Thermoanaerobaculia bacterium]|nr:RDD family protein [Thermoanaerobaculia bacterium]